jgi:hypothetical protein
VSAVCRSRKPGSESWRKKAAEELKRGYNKLDAAATEARHGKADPRDQELGILAEEVIDVATRALVVAVRVTAPALGEEAGPHKKKDTSKRDTGTHPSSVMGLDLGDEKAAPKWTGKTVRMLEEAVPPLTRAATILKPHMKDSSVEVTILREEAVDIESRLQAARKRVDAEGLPAREPPPRAAHALEQVRLGLRELALAMRRKIFRRDDA